MLTKKELLRLEEIETKATQNYLEYAEYHFADWIDDEDIEEYARLTEKDQPIKEGGIKNG